MDAIDQDVYSQSPRKKRRGCEDSENGKDIISNLPECILTHILSLLPTNYIVQTSVLCPKWKYMWTKVPSLYFDEKKFSLRSSVATRRSFMNFVDRVLFLHGSSTLHGFYLSCNRLCDASRVNCWVSVIIKRQIQRLTIDYQAGDFVLPSSIFQCDTLTELNVHVSCTMKLSASHFSKLETLNLSGIKFINPNSGKVSLSFPMLKVFKVLNIRWANVSVLNLDAPALDTFVMEHTIFEVVEGSQQCVVKICSEKLRHLSCTYATQEVVLPQALSVVNALIGVYEDKGYFLQNMSELGQRACNLLKRLHFVEELGISNEILEENIRALLDFMGLRRESFIQRAFSFENPPYEVIRALSI